MKTMFCTNKHRLEIVIKDMYSCVFNDVDNVIWT